MPRAPQGRYWLLTIPVEMFTVPLELSGPLQYLRGQREIGGTTGYEHWQLLAVFKKKVTLRGVKQSFGDGIHAELSRSDAADAYVWKEDTRVAGTQFELGERAIRRNVPTDWEKVRENAKTRNFDDIPPDIYIRCYANLCRIASDNDQPTAIVRSARVFIGPTGTGKSRRAWEEATELAYVKNPRTKWWDGYKGEENVIIDEFRGGIDIAYLLIWLDRYPCRVEIKGSSMPLRARKFWICSNLMIEQWFPDCDYQTLDALRRRIEINYFE